MAFKQPVSSLVDDEKPDVILLSGDVYDRSYPPEEAVELLTG